jgi:hypothetical protein
MAKCVQAGPRPETTVVPQRKPFVVERPADTLSRGVPLAIFASP